MQQTKKIEDVTVQNLTQKQPYEDPIKNPTVVEETEKQDSKADDKQQQINDEIKTKQIDVENKGLKHAIDGNNPIDRKKAKEELTQEAIKESAKDVIKQGLTKQRQIEKKFNTLIKKSDDVLIRASQVFPFVLFPSEIVVDQSKINVIQRSFFKASQVHSMPIKDVQSVLVETAPYFAKLKIKSSAFNDDALTLDYLKKKDALKVRKIIEGLIICSKEDIDPSTDLASMSTEELVAKLTSLGEIKDTPVEIG